ncbi:MAG: porin [Polyangiaceae bacterium]
MRSQSILAALVGASLLSLAGVALAQSPTTPAEETSAGEPSQDAKDEPAAETPAPEPKPAPAPDKDAKTTDKPASEPVVRPLRKAIKLVAGPVTFTPVVLIQAQVLPYVGDDSLAREGDLSDSEGFRLRRARFGLQVDLLDQGRARVSVELGSREDGEARIHDAFLAYVGFPYLQVFGGALTVPFSRSAMASAGEQAMSERPLVVRSMTPGQQVGAVAHGEIANRAFIYDVGLFNGFSRSDRFFGGYAQNFAPLGNRFDGLAYTVRAATEPIGPLSASIADETHEAPRFGVGANYFYSDGSARGIHAFGGDALLHAAGFHLLAEFVYTVVAPKSDPAEPTGAVADVESLGFVGEAGYMILEDLLGIAARFEYIDAARAVDDEGDNWLVGASATAMFLDGMVRGTVEFTHREEIYGLSLDNDAALFQAQVLLP